MYIIRYITKVGERKQFMYFQCFQGFLSSRSICTKDDAAHFETREEAEEVVKELHRRHPRFYGCSDYEIVEVTKEDLKWNI